MSDLFDSDDFTKVINNSAQGKATILFLVMLLIIYHHRKIKENLVM